ncbi:hypothetical protein K438DRAFT_1969565 [Mycena galopus ATCC 62051]|nr:hypothetical protein K438DRAFT_1969565 [Mycena galopus ATCC 62051]
MPELSLYDSFVRSETADPPNRVLYNWIWLSSANPSAASCRALHGRIKIEQPTWKVSLKRIRLAQRVEPPNCLLVPAHAPLPLTRDDLQSVLCVLHVKGAHSSTAFEKFQLLLGDSPVLSLGAIYDRRPGYFTWYYEAFAPIGGGGLGTNPIVSLIFNREIKGDVLVLTSTPGNASVEPLRPEEAVKTLWYYLSGADAQQISRQRTLERMLMGLDGLVVDGRRVEPPFGFPPAYGTTITPLDCQTASHSLFSQYGFRPTDVLFLMAVGNVFASGSCALSLLGCGTAFRPNDLDFFSPWGFGLTAVKFLTMRSGYRVVRESAEYDDAASVARVWWLGKDDCDEKVNVVECLSTNPLDTITSFHSTAVMNAWCAAGLWMAYPALTLQGLTLTTPHLIPFVTDDVNSQERAYNIVNKYRMRGFDFLLGRLDYPHSCGHELACPATLRRSDDAGCLFVPFPLGQQERFRPVKPLPHVTQWNLRGAGCLDPGDVVVRNSSGVGGRLYADTWTISRPIWAPVPICQGSLVAYSASQTDAELWIDAGRGGFQGTMDSHVNCYRIDRFPPDDVAELKHPFTVVAARQGATGQFLYPVNRLINELVPELDVPWRGNVLVLKHGKTTLARIVHLEEQDYALVDVLVRHVIRNKLVGFPTET